MPHSKQHTTRLTPNSAQPKRQKKRTTAWTQDSSNSSTPKPPITVKKLLKSPTT